MRTAHLFCLVLLCSVAAAQVNFDCQALGVFPPIGGGGDCEGVTSNGTTAGFNLGTGVSSTGACGFPTTGAQFARIVANGPMGTFHVAGTPIARPAPAIIQEIQVALPPGTTYIQVCYNLYNAEAAFGPATPAYNDGVEFAIVDATGATVLFPVAYADTYTPLAPGACQDPTQLDPEAGAAGPDFASASFPGGLPTGAYLSIACWNMTDNGFISSCTIDAINFNPTACPGCAGSSAMGLAFTSPLGAGSLQVDITSGLGSGTYFLGITFYQGIYPNGWLFGVDLPLAEFSTLVATGFPFIGPLDMCGNFTLGPITGLGFLSGVPFYATAVGIPLGSPVPTTHSPAQTASVL